MKHQIANATDDLEITIDGVEGNEMLLLDVFQDCQEGRCACPTREYQKLESLQIERANGEINLHLKPKEGTKFDRAEIERCLKHTGARVKPGK